jgi:hypothetical protein
VADGFKKFWQAGEAVFDWDIFLKGGPIQFLFHQVHDFLFSTDGLTEARDAQGNELETAWLEKIIVFAFGPAFEIKNIPFAFGFDNPEWMPSGNCSSISRPPELSKLRNCYNRNSWLISSLLEPTMPMSG